MAECYAYDTIGQDPLRQLIRELGLTTVAAHSSAVVLNGALLRDDEDIRRYCGERTPLAIEDFRQQSAALLPLASWYRGFTPRDNAIRGRAARAKRFWTKSRIRSRGTI